MEGTQSIGSFVFVGSECGNARAGLRTVRFDARSGTLTEVFRVADAKDPIYFARSRDGRFLYVAEDVADACGGALPGGVSAYRIGGGGTLERVSSVALAPTVPCHVSLSPDGRFLAWAEYANANVGVVCVRGDGRLEAGPTVRHDSIDLGPRVDRQEAAHAHWAGFTEDGRRVRVCDLGRDRVFSYACNVSSDGCVSLERKDGEDFVAPAGAGPRHLCHLPGGDGVLLLSELSSELFLLRWPVGAAPEMLARQSLLPPDGCRVPTKAAAVRLSPSRRWVLASNRGHDSIAAFRLSASRTRLEPGPISALTGPFPRDFVFLPDGRHVLVGHKLGGEVAVYAWDEDAGRLTPTGATLGGFVRPLCFACADSPSPLPS